MKNGDLNHSKKVTEKWANDWAKYGGLIINNTDVFHGI
jgi:hypothetical protein